jgi:putative redox protein
MGNIVLRWVEEKVFIGTDSNGHSIVIGRNASEQNPWEGIKPSDLLLLAVASCAVYDVIEILQKQREPVVDLRVECSGNQAPEAPWTFTAIHNHYKVYGEVNTKKLARAIQLSEDKYCSVINSLRPQVTITSDFEVIH